MQFLTVTACLYCIHHDILGCHERKLCHHVFLDNLRIYNQTVNNIQVQIQNTINCKEAFRNTQTLVRRIIQCTLKPLGRCNHHRVHHVCHHIVSQGSHTLASHRISLICHSGGTDLILLERLFYFFQMLKKTDIVGEFMGTLCNTGKNI